MRYSDFVKAAIPTFATYVAATDSLGPFSLYAYGPGVGGMSLFSTGGTAYFVSNNIYWLLTFHQMRFM